jgi:hypothetical protein
MLPIYEQGCWERFVVRAHHSGINHVLYYTCIHEKGLSSTAAHQRTIFVDYKNTKSNLNVTTLCGLDAWRGNVIEQGYLFHFKIKHLIVTDYKGFGGFLDLREKIFFLSRNTGGCLATVDRVFLQ